MTIDELIAAAAELSDEDAKKLMAGATPLGKERDRIVAKSLETFKARVSAGSRLLGDPPEGEPEEPEPKDKPKTTDPTTRERDLERRIEVMKLAAEKGIPIAEAFAAIGLDAEGEPLSDTERIERIAEHDEEVRQAERMKIAGANGRTPHQSIRLRTAPLTLEQIVALPPDQQELVSPDESYKAVDEYVERARSGGFSQKTGLLQRVFGRRS